MAAEILDESVVLILVFLKKKRKKKLLFHSFLTLHPPTMEKVLL